MRMLIVNGRSIVPLRAVYSLSAGEIPPVALVLAIAERSPFIDDREYATKLTASWLLDGQEPCALASAEFTEILERVDQLARANASVEEQLRALPAGMFVYRTDLETLVREINERRLRRPPDGPELPPIELSTWKRDTATRDKFLLEGFESLVQQGRGTGVPRRERCDPVLQQRACKIADEILEKTGRHPLKKAVVKRLRLEFSDKSEADITRSIRKLWGRARRARQLRATA